MKVRVRFAPSPTGHLHIGGARTALFNWLFARKHRGTYILRIEDTDLERSREELVQGILEGLEWLGLDWDEGPFYQSQRMELYDSTCRKLLEEGKAYRCFCATDETPVTKVYDKVPPVDPCRHLSKKESDSKIDGGGSFTLRFRTPRGGGVRFTDQVFGDLEISTDHLEDFIILRSDRTPTYHLSVVADDIDMGITHVIRGADHLSNTPKHVLLFESLGRPAPEFAHLPLILGTDRKRLSKRHGATSVLEYRSMGYLPQAIRNYLALLGWSPGGDQEFFREQELCSRFDLGRVHQADAVFDMQKLEWMNGKHLSEATLEELEPEVRRVLMQAGLWRQAWEGSERQWFLQTVDLLKKGLRRVTDYAETAKAFFSEDFELDCEAVARYLDPEEEEERKALRGALEELTLAYGTLEPFDLAGTEHALRTTADHFRIKPGKLIGAVRVAMTGRAHAPGIFEVLTTLGRSRALTRLGRASQMLGSSADSTSDRPSTD